MRGGSTWLPTTSCYLRLIASVITSCPAPAPTLPRWTTTTCVGSDVGGLWPRTASSSRTGESTTTGAHRRGGC